MSMEEIELSETFIVLGIPEDTVEVTIQATIYRDGELKLVQKRMGLTEVREAIKEADDNYIPGDAVFTLTPLGEKLAAKLSMNDTESEEDR